MLARYHTPYTLNQWLLCLAICVSYLPSLVLLVELILAELHQFTQYYALVDLHYKLALMLSGIIVVLIFTLWCLLSNRKGAPLLLTATNSGVILIGVGIIHDAWPLAPSKHSIWEVLFMASCIGLIGLQIMIGLQLGMRTNPSQ